MKIIILGAGAMGSWFGGKLALSGQNVVLLTTNREHREAVMENTEGRGAEIVIEAVGRTGTILHAIDVARAHGDVVFFGLPDGSQPVLFSYLKFFMKRRASSIY